VNSAWRAVYYLLILTAVAWFAVYDAKKKRVPDKALVFFLPASLAAPFINVSASGVGIGPQLLDSLSGAAAGFVVLLAAALVSKGGSGVGGGDIKLAAVLGLVYGPAGIIAVLLIASLLAMPAGFIRRKQTGGQILRLPFVPFMAAGCLAVTMTTLF
jgi:prepilin signal peptidase PulO-like enzyme (type II secretory pathway)